LNQLTQDFEHVAALYGRVIISEHRIPNDKKTIKGIVFGMHARFGVSYVYLLLLLSVLTQQQLTATTTTTNNVMTRIKPL
jgi:hypothetical protein